MNNGEPIESRITNIGSGIIREEVSNITLTDCQRKALDYIALMEPGEALFLTGQAGTGKSHLLELMQHEFKAITVASTGLAAVRVGGITAHACFGLGIEVYVPHSQPFRISKRTREAIEAADYLFIDEASMVRADVLDAISDACKFARQDHARFGGLRVVMIGDCFQLPPVVNNQDVSVFTELYPSAWFFDAMCLTSDLPIIELNTVMRQKDFVFINALNALRIGRMSGLDVINTRVGKPSDDVIQLVAYNQQAERINLSRLDTISVRGKFYHGESTGNFRESEYPVPETLLLKPGARVVLMRNGKDYSNGDMGTVSSLHNSAVVVLLDRGHEVTVEYTTWEKGQYTRDIDGKLHRDITGTYRQVPIRLGYAISVHKSQGQTYEKVHLDIAGKMFAPGQAYVALSRCKTLEGMTISAPITPKDVLVSERVIEFFDQGNWVLT